jgi:hypothetical protein
MSDARKRVRARAHEALGRGDAVGWFDPLYRDAAGDIASVPWADLVPNPKLVELPVFAWLHAWHGQCQPLLPAE